MSIFSFVTSVGVVGTAGYVYVNQDKIKENIKEQVTKGVQDAVVSKFNTPALPKATGGVLPAMPKVTGGAIPF
tara:strand:+ start:198 stop:416 length:219 start_codon:yes stop_codon:yes gene_type:complete